MLKTQKRPRLTQTIEGAVGVSKRWAALSPVMTEIDPITAVRATMPSGVRASCRAAAAGIINIAADADHEDHDEHKDGHDHHGIDPHAWLSAKNASVWLSVIAAHLSEIDPKNKETYKTNAAVGQKDLTDLATDISKTLNGVRRRSFIVYHDAFQYFENDFNFIAAGAISPSDAAPVSPARIAAIRSMIEKEGIDCILSEPQYSQGLIQSVSSGTEVNLGIIDAIGAGITIGPDLYDTLMRNMAKTFADCF